MQNHVILVPNVACCRLIMDSSASCATEAAGDPGPSMGSDFTLLYSSPDVGQTVEVQPEAEQEPSRVG